MQDIPLTQILVLLAFILFPLINWLLQRMQRRFEQPNPDGSHPQPAPRTDREAAADGSYRFVAANECLSREDAEPDTSKRPFRKKAFISKPS